MNIEGTRREFSARAEFAEFVKSEDLRESRESYIEMALNHIRNHGLWCEFNQQQAQPESVSITSDNYRETITFKQFFSRLRAVNHEVLRLADPIGENAVRIYAPEAVTRFALAYRGRFPKFIGSEYTEDPQAKEDLFPVPIEDLHELTFPSDEFDVVVASEVFEHVPFLNRALREIARVLRTGGHLVATFPFHAGSDESIIKATLNDGKVEYLCEPEYHGNPVDAKGSLVFQIPGWDILETTKEAGFETAKMVWHYSPSLGILARDAVGVMTLVAKK